MIATLRKLAQAATRKNHSHGFAIDDRRDCTICWAEISAAQDLHAALRPEVILKLLAVISAAAAPMTCS